MVKFNYKLLFVNAYKYVNTIILAFIAYFLFQIYQKLPTAYSIEQLEEITLKDRERKQEDRYYKKIKAYPNYILDGEVDANINEPLGVKIVDGDPIKVEIYR